MDISWFESTRLEMRQRKNGKTENGYAAWFFMG